MTIDPQFLTFAVSTALILITPGPTNTLLATAGLTLGMRKALRLLAVELAGYVLAISTWGIFLISLQEHYPYLGTLLRFIGSGYLLYVAVKMWRAAKALQTSPHASISAQALFTATLLNPKGLVFASAVFPAQAFDDIQVYCAAMAVFGCLLLPIGFAWIAFGATLRSGKLARVNPFNFQRAAALLLGLFSVSMAWAAIS
ncbi:threonine/homoserine/homoserine lactone efflux protein [Paucimonas lemoignei]|uniref:Threonine/homoserine/homoserine lactone efflux protein n=1 Tax=Paucimonas lemoignei TaxID=29443 RepID=A0A4R3HSU9_PAULE|nr:LysE family transporter [Paucimonas lemoignei]TCS35543.1 threonine/homoserine/homoserine lactone efflux protein [Paucimonas lemoignei]